MQVGKFLIRCRRPANGETFYLCVDQLALVGESLRNLPAGFYEDDEYFADIGGGNSVINWVEFTAHTPLHTSARELNTLSKVKACLCCEPFSYATAKHRVISQDESWAEVGTRSVRFTLSPDGYLSFDIQLCRLRVQPPLQSNQHLRITRLTKHQQKSVDRVAKRLR